MNRLSQFWQELKRRKVIKVIAMYAGGAFVLIELANNVVVPLNLPDWTPRLVIIIALVGFPIVVMFSWIFDFTLEGIRKTESIENIPEDDSIRSSVKRRLKASDLIIASLFVAVCVLLYPKIFRRDRFEDIREANGKISIAVMPFENLTGDTTLNWFQRGISSLIINGLGNSSELSVRDDQTMYEVVNSMNQVFTSGISPSMAKEVAENTMSETYISGSYQGKEGKYWILVNLVDTESGKVYWTYKVEGDLMSSEYLDLADSLCNEIKNYLEITVLEEDAEYDFRVAYTKSAEAYRYFIEGMNSAMTADYRSAIISLEKALKIDSTFAVASFFIAYAFDFEGQPNQTKFWIQKTYKIKDRLPTRYQLWLESWYAIYITRNMQDISRYCNLLEESGLGSRLLWFDLGTTYFKMLQQYNKAIKAFERVEEINLERGDDWKNEFFYYSYGKSLHEVGKHEKEKEIHEMGLRLLPGNYMIISNQATCAISQGDIEEANARIQDLKSSLKEPGFSESVIERMVAIAYMNANMMDSSEVHFRKAYALDPQDPFCIYHFAYFLINNDINVDEGIDLIQKGLDQKPEFLYFLAIKGWGLYKQGHLYEAIHLLRKADEGFGVFEYELYQQILEVEQALASQNN